MSCLLWHLFNHHMSIPRTHGTSLVIEVLLILLLMWMANEKEDKKIHSFLLLLIDVVVFAVAVAVDKTNPSWSSQSSFWVLIKDWTVLPLHYVFIKNHQTSSNRLGLSIVQPAPLPDNHQNYWYHHHFSPLV